MRGVLLSCVRLALGSEFEKLAASVDKYRSGTQRLIVIGEKDSAIGGLTGIELELSLVGTAGWRAGLGS